MGKQKEKVHLDDLGAKGRIILKHMLKKQDGMGVDRINLAHDRGKWRALLDTVLTSRTSTKFGEFLECRMKN
jgi:hypothetical protein